MTKSGKHCGKRGNCTFLAISPFVSVFKKLSAAEVSESVYMRERVKSYVKRRCGKMTNCSLSNFFLI